MKHWPHRLCSVDVAEGKSFSLNIWEAFKRQWCGGMTQKGKGPTTDQIPDGAPINLQACVIEA